MLLYLSVSWKCWNQASNIKIEQFISQERALAIDDVAGSTASRYINVRVIMTNNPQNYSYFWTPPQHTRMFSSSCDTKFYKFIYWVPEFFSHMCNRNRLLMFVLCRAPGSMSFPHMVIEISRHHPRLHLAARQDPRTKVNREPLGPTVRLRNTVKWTILSIYSYR